MNTEEHLSILIEFIKKHNIQEFRYTEDDVYYIKNNIDAVNEIVNLSCKLNKRIYSDDVIMAIEELSANLEVLI